MKFKTCPAKVKAAGEADGLEDGQFEAIVSVFNNVDSMGDVVMPGAFKDDIAEWAAKGDPIPVLWSHDWSDPFSHIGVVLAGEERAEGLWVRAQIDLVDDEGNPIPKARQVNRLLKGRRVTQFSFAYDILEAAWGKREDLDVYELRKLHIFEVGPTLVGANSETELLAAKSVGDMFGRLTEHLKAGRVLSGKNESALRSALDKIADGVTDVETVLAALDETDDGKATANRPNDPASPPAMKATSPAGPAPASVRLLCELDDFDVDELVAG